MAKERLSRLQGGIITVLKVLDQKKYEDYKGKEKDNLPPYWHLVRNQYEDHRLWIRGLKDIVSKYMIEQYEAPKIEFGKSREQIEKDKSHPKFDCFYKSRDTGEISKIRGYKIWGGTSYDVSFSRSLSGLRKKGYLEFENTKNELTRGYCWRPIRHQIRRVKLTDKGINVNL